MLFHGTYVRIRLYDFAIPSRGGPGGNPPGKKKATRERGLRRPHFYRSLHDVCLSPSNSLSRSAAQPPQACKKEKKVGCYYCLCAIIHLWNVRLRLDRVIYYIGAQTDHLPRGRSAVLVRLVQYNLIQRGAIKERGMRAFIVLCRIACGQLTIVSNRFFVSECT